MSSPHTEHMHLVIYSYGYTCNKVNNSKKVFKFHFIKSISNFIGIKLSNNMLVDVLYEISTGNRIYWINLRHLDKIYLRNCNCYGEGRKFRFWVCFSLQKVPFEFCALFIRINYAPCPSHKPMKHGLQNIILYFVLKLTFAVISPSPLIL